MPDLTAAQKKMLERVKRGDVLMRVQRCRPPYVSCIWEGEGGTEGYRCPSLATLDALLRRGLLIGTEKSCDVSTYTAAEKE